MEDLPRFRNDLDDERTLRLATEHTAAQQKERIDDSHKLTPSELRQLATLGEIDAADIASRIKAREWSSMGELAKAFGKNVPWVELVHAKLMCKGLITHKEWKNILGYGRRRNDR